MMTSLTAFIRRHVLLFGVVKFFAGLVIGFGLGLYFLPTLTAEKALIQWQSRHCRRAPCGRAHLSAICPGQMGCIVLMG